jgi:hypothetical protein
MVGATHGVGGGRCDAHAGRVGGALERFARGLREQNIPRGDALDAFLAQPRGDGLARFAKADETDERRHVRHRVSFSSDQIYKK